ncbi:Pre-rRNA-processing protein TSR1-like protein [Drosera capensis]
MGGARVQVNKPHKTRFASKSTRNVHKFSLKDMHENAKVERSVGKGARAARIQRCKMIRDQKRAAVLNEKRATGGSTSPPRVIVLFGLSADVDLNSLEKDLLALLSAEKSGDLFSTVASSEYKLRITVLKAPHRDLLSCMEMAKVADLMAFVASTTSSSEEDASADYIDSFGTQCLSVFKAIGLPTSVVLIRDLPEDPKGRHTAKKACTSYLAPDFPEDCKFYAADSKDELHKFMWLFKEQRITAPHWRNQRAYVAAEKVDLVNDDPSSGKCTVLLTGYLRGRSLSVNQLVHVSGAGDFQFSKIELLKDPFPLNPRKGQYLMDADDMCTRQVIHSFAPDCSKQEPLLIENIPDPLAGEQTWPTEAEMAEAEENQKRKKMKKKKLPRGTSEYQACPFNTIYLAMNGCVLILLVQQINDLLMFQAAWIIDDSDEDDPEDGDDAEGEDDSMVLDEENDPHPGQDLYFDEDQDSLNLRDSDTETVADSVMADGESMTREQIEDEIKKIKASHAEDEEFPDEVDTPLDIAARKRFAKYRGLKSFRTSSWDPKESLPPEYAKIFEFDNFARTQKHVLAKALEMDQSSTDLAKASTFRCLPSGSYVTLHIKEVPVNIASKLSSRAKAMPVIACGLLQHESKMSVLHFSIKKYDTYEDPIRSKEELIFHVGFREFVARPLFSSDNLNSDKHKMERFLHAGRFSVASIFAPISFPRLPLIALKSKEEEGASSLVLAAVGSLKSIDPGRIILKKIILTGYPQRVSKLKAIVRYMFHNPEDVRWFKPLEVWTKGGRRGRVKEPVGTHGAMKCVFNGILQQSDTVCMTLYKRSYSKWPERKFPLSEC